MRRVYCHDRIKNFWIVVFLFTIANKNRQKYTAAGVSKGIMNSFSRFWSNREVVVIYTLNASQYNKLSCYHVIPHFTIIFAESMMPYWARFWFRGFLRVKALILPEKELLFNGWETIAIVDETWAAAKRKTEKKNSSLSGYILAMVSHLLDCSSAFYYS